MFQAPPGAEKTKQRVPGAPSWGLWVRDSSSTAGAAAGSLCLAPTHAERGLSPWGVHLAGAELGGDVSLDTAVLPAAPPSQSAVRWETRDPALACGFVAPSFLSGANAASP